MQPPHAMTEADDFFLDLLDETPQRAQASASSWAETPAPSFESAQAISTPTDELEAGTPFNPEEATTSQPQAQDFAEAHYQTQQDFPIDSQLAPTERLPDDYQLEAASSASPVSEAAPESAATESRTSHAGQITLEQLSPEVIDAIARRAAEHLSERVVEQIAWEVVPDLAELLIKRRLEEGKQ